MMQLDQATLCRTISSIVATHADSERNWRFVAWRAVLVNTWTEFRCIYELVEVASGQVGRFVAQVDGHYEHPGLDRTHDDGHQRVGQVQIVHLE